MTVNLNKRNLQGARVLLNSIKKRRLWLSERRKYNSRHPRFENRVGIKGVLRSLSGFFCAPFLILVFAFLRPTSLAFGFRVRECAKAFGVLDLTFLDKGFFYYGFVISLRLRNPRLRKVMSILYIYVLYQLIRNMKIIYVAEDSSLRALVVLELASECDVKVVCFQHGVFGLTNSSIEGFRSDECIVYSETQGFYLQKSGYDGIIKIMTRKPFWGEFYKVDSNLSVLLVGMAPRGYSQLGDAYLDFLLYLVNSPEFFAFQQSKVFAYRPHPGDRTSALEFPTFVRIRDEPNDLFLKSLPMCCIHQNSTLGFDYKLAGLPSFDIYDRHVINAQIVSDFKILKAEFLEILKQQFTIAE